MIPRASLLLAAALCALPPAVRAGEKGRAPPRIAQQPEQQQEEKPLSAEDAEIVKQLAVLEQVEMLRNLDLFEPPPSDVQQAKQQPDASNGDRPQRAP